ncbi:MAG: efflux RND transporter periplasmic adaptor subunit [Hyphomicrobiales bacterium]|nr:efflux RND transporter periplasmic adaptor subunit [Hyphomicrobiales bacterium]
MLSKLLNFVGFLAAALIGGALVAWIGRAPVPPAAEGGRRGDVAALAPPAVPTTEVGRMPAAARVKLGGVVEPHETVRLTAQAPGRVVFVAAKEGDRLASGQVVVALDDDALAPEYRAAWAGLAGDMAATENARTQLYHTLYGQRTAPMGGPAMDAYERMFTPFYNMAQGVFGNMFPGLGGGNQPMMTQSQAQRSWPALNNARADWEARMAGLVAAQSRLDGLDQRLRDRRAVAPTGGVLLARHVRVGDVVQPGQPLADVADVDRLEVRLDVPTNLVGALSVGDQVPITLGSTNLWAPIGQIYPTADPAQRTVTVKLSLPQGAPAASGMYAVAWLAQAKAASPSADAPAVPTSAIARRGSQPMVFVIDGRGRVDMRIVRLGDVVGDRVAVLSGLTVGERVVSEPAPDLQAGDTLFAARP